MTGSAEKGRGVPGNLKWPDPKEISCPRTRALLEWCDDAAGFITIHGVSWFQRTQNMILRGDFQSIILLYTIAAIICIPLLATLLILDFYHDTQFSSNVEFKTVANLTFPNITVCHTRYFDKGRMEEYGVNDTLAAYMTSVLDIGYSQQFKTMKADPAYGVAYVLQQNQSETELNRVLTESNLDLLELFEALAVRCDDFIPMCEIHREFYPSTSIHPGHPKPCCGYFFEKKPFFTYQGTCFTTKEAVTETYPSSSASIRVWLDNKESASPDFSLLMRGSDAAERQGVIWTLSHEDHPKGVLQKDFNRVDSRKVSAVSITMSEQERSQITSEICVDRNTTFEDVYGVNITKNNCDNAYLDHFFNVIQNCSLLPFYGWKNEFGLRLCSPWDLILAETTAPYQPGDEDSTNFCHRNCREKVIRYQTTTSSTVRRALDELMNDTEGEFSKDITILQFYFSSFDYPIYHLTQETFSEFFSNLGGYLGLAVGASVLSFVEIFYFLLKLLGIFLRTYPEKK